MSEHESVEYDVVIVGGGPAGLSAAIRLKQLAMAAGRVFSVCVVEKGAEVGAHIMSGAVLDPGGLCELFTDWERRGAPVETAVTDDRFYYFTRNGAVRFPGFVLPPGMHNRGNYIVSLGALCRWLASQAETLGVEIYPGFAARALIVEEGAVRGVVTGDMGIAKDGRRKPDYTPGVALRGCYTLFAEGARGSLSKELIARFGLDKGRNPQKFGIGLKELWEIPQERHQPGLVIHGLGWPLTEDTGGGLFLYHWGENLCSVGLVVHLDYANPWLDPFCEFQRVKTHPMIRKMLEGGRRLSYGARAVAEGGIQSVPKLALPGGALIGCAAGLVNLPRIKGIHNAMRSGMMAANAAFAALMAERAHDTLEAYEAAFAAGAVARELRLTRNAKPLWSRLGTLKALPFIGLDLWCNRLFGVSPFGTLNHRGPDHAALKKAAECPRIVYPRPDGTLTFDRPSSVSASDTGHAEDQPAHLLLRDPAIPIKVNLPVYAEPAQRYCPAGVYEIVEEETGPRFLIHAQNCVHCKTCDIKDPAQNITWVPPEGGGGPHYANM